MDDVPLCGFVQARLSGLKGVPEPDAVRAVVFRVSVNVVVPPAATAVITLPLLSTSEPEPEPACRGALITVPDRAVTVADGALLTDAVYPEPSVAVPVPEPGGPPPQPKVDDQVETATGNGCATPKVSW